MNAATISLGAVLAAMFFCSVGLFWVNEPAAGWTLLVTALISTLSLLGMIVSTARVRDE